ncbi:hypothetical protein [uncultured Thalassospira sp.]|uniref:hypothetical protein n=1 Tax=uncultured Thalassospira sp. TaxID=404382 RepID=UPI00258BECC3|nr:hypothetical protein [uncultured Thalassospira sp.]
MDTGAGSPVRVLFFPEGERYWQEIVPLLNYLALDPGFEVHALMQNEPYQVTGNPREHVPTDVLPEVVLHECPARPDWGSRLMARFEGWVYSLFSDNQRAEKVLNTFPVVLLLASFDLIDFVFARCKARKILSVINPDVLMVTRDRNLGLQTAMIRLMKRRNRKTVVVPWGYPNTSFLLASRATSPRNQADGYAASIVQKLMVKNDHPHILEFRGKAYSYYKPGRFLAACMARICPSKPFGYGADADLCMVESETTKVFLAGLGTATNSIVVTGNPVYDSLYKDPAEREKIRSELAAKYGAAGSQLVMFAIPHTPEHNLLDWETHRSWLRRMVEALLSPGNITLLLSIHPRSDPENYRFLWEEYPVFEMSETLRYCLPAADYFVCHWSGTTVWGPLLRVPTLVLDVYSVPALGFEYLLDSVFLIKDMDQLDQSVQQFYTDPPKPNLKSLPPFDGQSRRRIVDCIRALPKAASQ